MKYLIIRYFAALLPLEGSGIRFMQEGSVGGKFYQDKSGKMR